MLNMIDHLFVRSIAIFLSLSLSACLHAQPDCQTDNQALQSMPEIQVTLTRADGSTYVVATKLANNNRTRAAGFQRVCESTIEAMPILFVFTRENIPQFHMNNVVAPIDIAFIDKVGRVESIQSMKPYSVLEVNKKLYSPKRPVMYALEVHQGFFKKHNIASGSIMTWSSAASD